jgi:small subunit ribosomal protein S13
LSFFVVGPVARRQCLEAVVARIAGVDLPRNKKMGVALTYLYGVGPVTSLRILGKANVDPNKRSDELGEDEVARIRDVLESAYKVEGDLRRDVALNIKRLMDLGCYRGLRHRRGLPVHGQRTHTNARTRKGPRKSVARKGK